MPSHTPLAGSVPGHGLFDFSADQLRGMNVSGGGMSALTNIPSGLGGMHGVDMTTSITGVQGMTSSPLMIPGDDSMLLSGAYTTPSPHQPQQPPTRPASGSNSGSISTGPTAHKDPLTEPALVEPHMRYYFDSVLQMQYVFASEKAHGVLQTVCTSS